MSTITIRIPDDLKREMAKVDVNWSVRIREAIHHYLAVHRRARIHRKIGKVIAGGRGAPAGTAERLIRQMRDNRSAR